MNARPLHCLLLAAAFGASASTALPASPQNELPMVYSVHSVTSSTGGVEIQRGMSRVDVAWALRDKFLRVLSPDLYAYSGFRASVDGAIESRCDTILVTFAQGKVTEIQLINRAAVSAIAANLSLGRVERTVASK